MTDSTMTIDEFGTKRWRNSAGQYHRIGQPAVERADGDKEWWVNGKCHRTDGPAVEYANGHKSWWINDKLHRIEGPAVEYADGDKSWYVNGKFLGRNDKGFWKLWEYLTPEKKKDPTLLTYLPGDFHV